MTLRVITLQGLVSIMGVVMWLTKTDTENELPDVLEIQDAW